MGTVFNKLVHKLSNKDPTDKIRQPDNRNKYDNGIIKLMKPKNYTKFYFFNSRGRNKKKKN